MTRIMRRNDRPGPMSVWDPFSEMEDLYTRMGQLFQGTVNDMTQGSSWVPLADVTETEDAYVVEIETPGASKDDLSIDLTGDTLTVSGEVRSEEEGHRHHRTRRTGRFEYRAVLPGNVDSENVNADYNDGVLKVRLPKSSMGQQRRIPIQG